MKGVQTMAHGKALLLRTISAMVLSAAALVALVIGVPHPDSIEAYLNEIYGGSSVRYIGGEYYNVIYRPLWDEEQQTFVPSENLYSFSAPDTLEAYTGPFYSLTSVSPQFEYGQTVYLELTHDRKGTSRYASGYQLDYFSDGAWYTLNPAFAYDTAEHLFSCGDTLSIKLSAKTLAQATRFDRKLNEYIIEEREIPLRQGRYRYSRAVYEKGTGKEYLLSCEFEIV